MNIVFMGTPEFAIPSLEKLFRSGFTISAVVSNIDKRRGRGSATEPTPVKAKALELNIPVIEVEDLKSQTFAEQLRALEPDLFVVVAFRILPKTILEIPKIGAINLHASLLPKYRGAAPIHWAVINGEEETGCTIFFLDEKVDTGNIILQKRTSIGENETTGELYDRLKDIGSEALVEAVQQIKERSYNLQKQNDSEATPAPKLFREDAHLSFAKPAKEVHNKIRGLSPFPTAWSMWGDKKFNIYASRLGPHANVDCGEIFVRNGKLLVGCEDGTLELLEVQLPGKKRIKAEDFIKGYEIEGYLY